MRDERAGGGRLWSIDALRGVAVLLVVLAHTDFSFIKGKAIWNLVGPFALNGGTGVTLFLVLSGLSIHLRWARTAQPGQRFEVASFWKRRFVRLYPTYWAALAVVFATLYAAYGSSLWDRKAVLVWGGTQPGWLIVLNHATVVLANVVPATFIGRSWSLALEEQIYGLYSLLQRLQRFDPQRFVLPALAMSIGFIAMAQLVTGGWNHEGSLWAVFALFQVPTNAFAWVLGAWIAEAHAGRRTLPGWFARPSTSAALLAVGVLLRYHSMPLGRLSISGLVIVPVFSAGYASLAAWMLQRSDAHATTPRLLRPLVTVGLWSYSVYLLHQPFLDLVDRRLRLSRAIEIPLGWALAIAASGIFFHLVERHFIRRAAARPRTLVEPTRR